MTINHAYFGLPLGALCLLHDGRNLDPIVLAPVEAPGRRRLRRLAGDRVIDALEDKEFAERVEESWATCEAQSLLSWFWTRRLPAEWLNRVETAYGVHPSLLPRHRGPDPFFWTIDQGDDTAGVSVHALDVEYDTGSVVRREPLGTSPRGLTAWQLARQLDRPSLRLLRWLAAELDSGGTVRPLPQDETQATWAPFPAGDQLNVDWNWSTERVLRRIRALSPAPGLTLELEGVLLGIEAARPSIGGPPPLAPGEAAAWGDPPRLTIRTGDGAIVIEQATRFQDGEERPLDCLGLVALVSARNHLLDSTARREMNE